MVPRKRKRVSALGEYKIKNQEKTAEMVRKAYQKVENAVVGTYKKIENGVVDAYQRVEDTALGGYQKNREKVRGHISGKGGGQEYPTTECGFRHARAHGQQIKSDFNQTETKQQRKQNKAYVEYKP